MKTTLSPFVGAGANQLSCVNISREKRELHASPKHKIADSLAKFTGIIIARGKSMKSITLNLLIALCLGATSLQVHAQGQVVDQESYPSPINTFAEGVDGLYLTDEPNEQFLQSFIPSLSAIDFVAMEFEYGTGTATVGVNLYEGSPNAFAATLVGTTTAVTMPSGFNNNGLAVAGVQDFYFTTPITLTAGDTYYLEPILVSGGSQWSFVTIIDYNTYPNGELYVNGYPFVTSTDIWFKEGIEAVPEPTAGALTGVACIVACIFRKRLKLPKLPVIVFAGALLTISVLSTNASQDSVVQATADAAGLTPVSTASQIGTFWVATVDPNGGLTTLPYPSLPTNMMDLPIYIVTNDIYIVDDTKGEISSSSKQQVMSSAEASSVAQEQSQTIANLIDLIDNAPAPSTSSDTGNANGYPLYQADGLPAIFETTNAWIQATNESPVLGLLLENAMAGDNYQLLSTTNLLASEWDLGQILTGVSAGENDFNPVPYTNAMMFFRVHQANPIMKISAGQPATEPDPTNSDPGQVGTFFINNEWYAATTDTTIYYAISGTAQNGVDYSNLAGSVILPANQNQVQINIEPIADGLKPNQSIIFTLKQNSNYLIDPGNDFASNLLSANPQVYPTVNGDSVNVCPNSTADTFLQANDPRGLPLTFTINTWPTHGVLNTNSIPFVTYTATNYY